MILCFRATPTLSTIWDCARVLKVVRENGEVAVRPLHLALPGGDPEGTMESDAA